MVSHFNQKNSDADERQASDADAAGAESIVILAPVYEDWESSFLLLKMLDQELRGADLKAKVVFIDDGSIAEIDEHAIETSGLQAITEVTVVRLAQNLGNQRAVAVGVGYVASDMKCDYLVVMDSDLEDLPEYVPQLIEASRRSGGKMVFAERTKRSEGMLFKVLYACYRMLFKVMTGHAIAIGNFSVIPGSLIKRAASISDIWNHFPAGIMRAKIPFETIKTRRGTRLHGKSKMNLVSLVIHGFSGLAVHADVVVVRAVLGVMLISIVTLALIAVLIGLNLSGSTFLEGWTLQIVGTLGGILFQTLLVLLLMVFLVLVGRNQRRIIPRLDFRDFIFETETIHISTGNPKNSAE